MGLLSQLLDLFRSLLDKLVGFLKKILGKYWAILLLGLLIFVAPMLAPWLSSIGAPSWLVSSMTWVAGNVTPMLTSLTSAVRTGATHLASQSWEAFSTSSIQTQAMVVLGASALIDPEGTADFIEDTTEAVAGLAVSGVTGALKGVTGSSGSTLLTAGLIAGALWFFWPSSKDSNKSSLKEDDSDANPDIS